jgi:hypothetical protein
MADPAETLADMWGDPAEHATGRPARVRMAWPQLAEWLDALVDERDPWPTEVSR